MIVYAVIAVTAVPLRGAETAVPDVTALIATAATVREVTAAAATVSYLPKEYFSVLLSSSLLSSVFKGYSST